MDYARYYLPGTVDRYVSEQNKMAQWWQLQLAQGWEEVTEYDDEGEPEPTDLARPEPAIERMLFDMAYWHSWENMTLRDVFVLAAFGAKGTASEAAPCVGVSRNTYARQLRQARERFYAEFYDPAGTGERVPSPPASARDNRLRREPVDLEEMLTVVAARRAVASLDEDAA
jgi:hypothetical protein